MTSINTEMFETGDLEPLFVEAGVPLKPKANI